MLQKSWSSSVLRKVEESSTDEEYGVPKKKYRRLINSGAKIFCVIFNFFYFE